MLKQVNNGLTVNGLAETQAAGVYPNEQIETEVEITACR